MCALVFKELAYQSLDDFIYGYAKKPVKLGNGMVIGGGTVYPEINFTLPPMLISESSFPKVIAQYEEIVNGVLSKAVELESSGLIVEVELLPPCTFNPQWGVEVTKVVKAAMVDYEAKFGLKSLLRMTPVDIREGKKLKNMYRGEEWDNLFATFKGLGEAGADFLAIESVGGKHLHDEAIMNCDLPKALFSLGVVAAHDMSILWDNIVRVSN
ncbi:MAG: methyltransferase MtaB domain-containing protein, partial [Desulfitobacterium hafniense]